LVSIGQVVSEEKIFFFYQKFTDDDRRQVMAIHVAHFGPGQLKMKAQMRLIFYFGILT
jgi:hypothetical protein